MKLTVKKSVLIGLILLGTYWCITSISIGLWVRKGPGGGFMPMLAGALCILFSVIILYQDWKKEATNEEKFKLAALIPVGALLGTILASYVIGVALSVAILIFLWLRLFEKLPLKNSIMVAIIWPGILYAVFVLWLQTPLPKGLLGLL